MDEGMIHGKKRLSDVEDPRFPKTAQDGRLFPNKPKLPIKVSGSFQLLPSFVPQAVTGPGSVNFAVRS